MKVAIIHYWLLRMRGGEKVLEQLSELFPDAVIYTHVADRENLSPRLRQREIRTTFISRLPFAKKYYQRYLALMPLALEQLDLSEFDLVISSESGPAKGVITRPDCIHICYCHTPMRYVWDMYHDYMQRQNVLLRWLIRPLLHYVRMWDFQSAARVDHFIANSQFVAQRIAKFYRRQASVIHPPIAMAKFTPNEEKDDYYLVLAQLVAYKRTDIAVEAFNKLGKRLLIVGTGEEEAKLKTLAEDNIEFLGWQTETEVSQLLSKAKALIFPGIEDFGMVPVEAMASGTPVIAFAKGGAMETIIDGESGILFHQQSASSLIDAVLHFDKHPNQFDCQRLRKHAEQFSEEIFRQRIDKFVQQAKSSVVA